MRGRLAPATAAIPAQPGHRSISAEAPLARAKTATAALVLVWSATAAAHTHLSREGIACREDVLGRRKRGARGRWRGTIATAAGSTTCRALWSIFRAIHAQPSPPEIIAVELPDCVGSFGIRPELGKRETARTAGLTISADVNACNLSGLGQQRGELLLGRVETQISDEDFVRNDRLLF
jgi:hypothetical protein